MTLYRQEGQAEIDAQRRFDEIHELLLEVRDKISEGDQLDSALVDIDMAILKCESWKS